MFTESSTIQEDLHATSLSILLAKLRQYGNEVSQDHHLALSALCELASKMAMGQLDKRVRFALPCGMGKSTAVRAILTAIHQLGLSLRVVVASSRVEELCALKRILVDEDGVHGSKIGLQHSYHHSVSRASKGEPGYASEPSGNEEAQFLLVTHANVQSGTHKAWMGRCDLVLFDESLIVGASQFLPLVRTASADSLLAEVTRLKCHAEVTDPQLAEAARTVSEIFDHLQAATERKRELEVGVVKAQCVDPERVQAARRQLAPVGRSFKLIMQMLDWCEVAEDLRVFGSSSDRTSLLTCEVTVPDSLTRVIVLDASAPIRRMVDYDHRMERAEDVLPSLASFKNLPGGMASIKQHAEVQFHFACEGGGRSSLSNALDVQDYPWFIEKLVRLLRRKSTESFLVFTYLAKERGRRDFTHRLVQALADAGIDQDELVTTPDGSVVPRIAISTWGKETGTNEYAAYQNVVLLGVLRKPEEAVASAYLGQVGDIKSRQMKRVVRSLVESEARHCILQAVNRVRMRRVREVDGVTQALSCNVYVWHRDPLLEAEMEVVLHGCPPWQPWREECESLKAMDVAMMIRDELVKAVAEGVSSISCRALRQRLKVDTSGTTFRRARDEALALLPDWARSRSTLVRTTWVPTTG